MTPQEFANKIRTKYPGSYDSVPDIELAQKVITKYPVYSTQVKFGEAPKKDLLAKSTEVVNKIFPGEKVGESIGALAGFALSPNKDQYDLSAPSPTQLAGDIASGALNVAGTKGVGTAGNFGQRLLKNIGLGAGLSASETIKDSGNIEDVVRNAAAGGVVGGALPIAGAGLRAIGRQIEQLPARFINSAFGRSKQQILNDIAKDKVDDFAKFVVNEKPIGTASQLLNESIDNVNTLSSEINSNLEAALRKSGSKVTIGRDNVLDMVAKLPEAEGALMKRGDIKGVIERLAPQTKQLLQKGSLNLIESNKLRQLVDKTLGDRAFIGVQLSSDKAVLKAFANSLREEVKNKAPEGTRQLFGELTNEIRFRDALLSRVAQKQGNQVLSFGDIIGGSLGAVFGGGVPGAAAGVAARRVIESVPFKLTSAKVIDAATKLEPVIDQLTPAQQTAILDFVSQIFSEDNREPIPQ